MSPSGSARTSAWRLWVLGVAVVGELVAGVTTVAVAPFPPSSAGSAVGRSALAAPVDPVQARTRAVKALLARRADAVRHRDRSAFLATLDPVAKSFRSRQAKLFDALHSVPLASWGYDLDPSSQQGPDPTLNARYDAAWWSPAVALRYTLSGFDSTPTVEPQHLTFVERGSRWYLAADDDFARRGAPSTRDLWDSGPVTVLRGRHTLVLGHPGGQPVMRRLATEVEAAIPRVDATWGRWSDKVVLLVPDSQRELALLIGSNKDLSQIAAVALAEITDKDGGFHPVGDRVIVNPPSFALLGELGRQVVLTHEVTHVASRADTGPLSPTWLIEGLADHVGYLQVRLPLAVTAAELRRDVRAGRLPDALPSDAAFAADSPGLSQAYEQAWLAVNLLVDRYGLARTLAFYREVGAARTGTFAAVVDAAMSTHLGTSLRAFTAAWRQDVRARLS